jgi:outer membrane protein assembly factor BamB
MNIKIISVLFCTLLLTNVFGSVAQNVKAPNPTSGGTGGLADSPWPMYRGNVGHTGLSQYDTSGNIGELMWSFTTGDKIGSSPAIGPDGTIYFCSEDRKLYAINPDGTQKWDYITSRRITTSPAIGSDGVVYFGSQNSYIYSINPDGTTQWKFFTGNEIYSSPAIGPDGTIYIGSLDGRLYALNPEGTKKWDFHTGGGIYSSPAIGSDGSIYVGSDSYKLYAIKPDGSQEWSYTTGGYVRTSPAIGTDGTIYVGSADHKLYAINPDGTKKWSFTMGSFIHSSPAIGPDDTIYIDSEDHKLYAIYPNGVEKWNFDCGVPMYSSPSIGSDGTIYVGNTGHTLLAIYPNGAEKWRFLAGGNFRESSPAIDSDGTIYIGSTDNKLYAIGTPTQNQPPIAYAGLDQTVNEGDVVQFDGSASYDPDGTIESYEWDFDASDGRWWRTGAPPEATSPTATHTYGDDGLLAVALRVMDDQGLTDGDRCIVTVLNMNPTISIESVSMEVEIGLRVAGRKYNDVSMSLYENDTTIGYVSIERLQASPDELMAWIPIAIDLSKSYSATVTYTPEDPPNLGANPVWVYLRSENGSIKEIHHTFNVQQSKKRDSDHRNHVEPWEVDLSSHFVGLPIEVVSRISDPGSDDETLTYTYGSQIVNVTYLNNPPNPDSYPSPEIKPVNINDITSLVYEGPGTVLLTVIDDDGGFASHATNLL